MGQTVTHLKYWLKIRYFYRFFPFFAKFLKLRQMIPIFYFELKMRLKLELILDFSSKVRVLSKCGTQIVSKKKKICLAPIQVITL